MRDETTILSDPTLSQSAKAAELVLYCGLSVGDAATRVGVSVGSVYVTMKRRGFSKRKIDPERDAVRLSTAERVALQGPRRFCDAFHKSPAARGLLSLGLITEPPSIREPAPLTPRGALVLEALRRLQ